MKKNILQYTNAKNNILKNFKCDEDFPLRPMINRKWLVAGAESIMFLSFWDETGEKIDFAVARQDGKPMIYKSKEYSMVIAIDCVKFAFIFKNSNAIQM